MKHVKNIFGNSIIFGASDIKGKIYVTCTACMSIFSEFLSWANNNKQRFVKNPEMADSIIVLSCQVTDLAILNDIKTLEGLKLLSKKKDYYIGGCLAYRFDIPINAKRLENIKMDYHFIDNTDLIDYATPFWIKDFKEREGEGNLFRHMYPLRIGVGCSNKCKYCTIRTTRGKAYNLDINKIENEFISHDDILIIADSISSKQISELCSLARKHKKPLSIRNIEPTEAIKSYNNISDISKQGLLKILHVPIQSSCKETLIDMNRNVDTTIDFIKKAKDLKSYTELATNIIIDYKKYNNPNIYELRKTFDHISWNPYWDGIWDRELAETRYNKYLGGVNYVEGI